MKKSDKKLTLEELIKKADNAKKSKSVGLVFGSRFNYCFDEFGFIGRTLLFQRRKKQAKSDFMI